MIRHPNFDGMQTDPATHALTPARFIKSIAVNEGDATVFTMETDIALASNPVIPFLYKKGEGKPFKATVVDSSMRHGLSTSIRRRQVSGAALTRARLDIRSIQSCRLC